MSRVIEMTSRPERLHQEWASAIMKAQAAPSFDNAVAAARAWWAFADEYDPNRDWQQAVRADLGATGS